VFQKIIKLFSNKEKAIILLLLFFLSFGALMEIISIALIVPFTSLLLNNTDFLSSEYIKYYFPYLLNLELTNLIYIFGIILCSIFIFKNIYLLVINYLSHKFIYLKYQNLASNIFFKYLNANYKEILILKFFF